MSFFTRIKDRAGFLTGRAVHNALQTLMANFDKIEPSVTTSGAADYVPALTDRIILRSRASAQTVTVPANADAAFPIGTQLQAIQSGTGALTIAAAVGVTINQLATKTLVVAGQYGRVTLTKVATNVWNLSGDLTAAS